jgi:predicted dehydrogenase/threonine dehydrogenase-like Zn-dependent dehydrogenase
VKQVLRSRSGLVVVRDVPEPHCPQGSIVVRNAFSAISSGTEGSALRQSRKSLVSRARERPDLVRDVVRRARSDGVRKTRDLVQRKLGEEVSLGYSSAGEVLRVGSAVRGISPGDHVACAGAGFANHAGIVAVPANLCARVPESVSLEAAALTTIAAIALHGVRLARVQVGERVAVIGCGLVGQIACRLLRAAGAEVFAIDLDETRVADAVEGGADHGFTTAEAEERIIALTTAGVDAALVTAAAPSNDPLLLAAEVARDRGAVVLVGDVPIELPRAALYEKELSFRISRSYGPGRYDVEYEERGLDYPIGYVRWTQQRNMECVLDLQLRGRLALASLIDDVVPVDDAAAAYARLGDDAERPRGAIILSYAVSAHRPPKAAEPVATPRPVDGAVRVGLIGPGGYATSTLVPALVEAGARLELVGGGSGPSSEAAVRNLGFSRVAESDEAVIDDPGIDAVVVATRHVSHAELATRALRAGKHVFCEKPLALGEEELAEVMRAARESERVLLVGFNRRFSPLLRELRVFLSQGPLLATYRVSAAHIPPSAWVHDLDQGGGRIVGEACHFLDCLAFLAGAPIRSVAAAAAGDPSLPLQARDNVVVNVGLGDASVGTISYVAAGASAVPKERLEVFSGARTAILDDYRRLELYDGDRRVREAGGKQDKGHHEELRTFVESVRSGVQPVPLDEIENVSLAALAVVESLRSGATVALRPGAARP